MEGDRLTERAVQLAVDPYLEVFGRFWDGMSFLIATSKSMSDLLSTSGAGESTAISMTAAVDDYFQGLESGNADWPKQFLLWQSYAYTVIEAHGLLDEYLRASFELLVLAEGAAEAIDPGQVWDPEAVERLHTLEARVIRESQRFEQLDIWKRVSRMRTRLGLQVRLGRALETAVKHHRRIRNSIVHGQLTPHAIMPDGSIARMREVAPPPYVPLGPHVVRGVMSVVLAVHERVDTAIGRHLGLPADPGTAILVGAQIAAGTDEWLVDPWQPHPEHLFDAVVLHSWRPAE